MKDFPFTENHLLENLYIREFSEAVDEEELVWHQDKEDRVVTVLESNNWRLQLDEQVPVVLEQGKKYSIPALMFHRVIKGDGILKIIVEKKETNDIKEEDAQVDPKMADYLKKHPYMEPNGLQDGGES